MKRLATFLALVALVPVAFLALAVAAMADVEHADLNWHRRGFE